MSYKKINAISLACALLVGLFSASANAFSVWAVEGGALSSSNSAGNPLVLSPGASTIDLYFDTEGEISVGWSILLEVTGAGTISGVTGGDINGGFGTAPTGSSWLQDGGDPFVDINSSSVLMFSFDFDAIAGAILSIGANSNYTNGTTYTTELIAGGDLVTVSDISAVPLPAAAWLFLSGIGFFGVAAKRKAASA